MIQRTVLVLSLSTLFIACRYFREESSDGPAVATVEESPEIKALIDKAYGMKGQGRNGEALHIFKTLEPMVAEHYGTDSEAMASLLDDQATCYLRGGDYQTARRRYAGASKMLQTQKKTDTRLYAGVHRRLRTLDGFEKAGVRCAESLTPEPGEQTPSGNADAGEDVVPYFPASDALHDAFNAFLPEMKGCTKTSSAIPIWNVVTNDGRVLLSSVKSDNVSASEAKCLEDKLMKAALKHRDKLPRFRACYRNFTYPAVFR